MAFKIVWDEKAFEDLNKLEIVISRRIAKKVKELEEKFVGEAKKTGFVGLKGHRSVGGVRASIYNAVPREAVDALVEFMKDFERKNG